jgi:CHAT domain-containing protein
VVFLIVAAGPLSPWRPSQSSALQALVAAVGSERPIDARLTGGFAYGPLRSATRAAAPSTTLGSPDVRIAAAQIEKEAIAHRTPQSLNALGIAYLVVGDVSRAVSVLEEAADQPKPDARIFSDLSAAYFVRAGRSNQPQDFARALTMAERAVKANDRLAEAWFNRACTLERMSLAEQARQAWQDYLKIDSSSPWAEEARGRLKTLSGSSASPLLDTQRDPVELAVNGRDSPDYADLVKKSPRPVREWVERQLLVEWPRLILEGRTEEARLLALRIEPLTDALIRQRDDAFFRDALAAVVKASTDRRRARTVANAYRIYQAAGGAYDSHRIAEATTLVRQALMPLSEAHSSFAVAARRYEAIGAYHANDLSAALAKIEGVGEEAQQRRYPQLLGGAYRLKALIHVVRGEFASALDSYETALKYFRLAGDTENEASIQSSLAENFQRVGDPQESWLAHYAALSQIGLVRPGAVRHAILQGASMAALRDGFPEAALHLQQAALDNAQRWGRPAAVVSGYFNRAQIYGRLNEPEHAAADLREALRFLSSVQDPLVVSRTEARILLARGETDARDRPTDAVETLSKALTSFERAGSSWPLASAYLARGRAHLSAHRDDRAQADFLAGIQVFERMRASLTPEGLRTSYFEQPWDLFSEMIRFQADRHDADRALMFAEQARARTVFEAVDAQGDEKPAAPADVQKMLPDGVAVLYYAALDDRLLIWVLTREGKAFVDTPVRQADIAHLVERYRSEAGSGRHDPSTLAALYDTLIRPVQRNLPDGARVVIVPDGVLHAVPFAALTRREDQRLFVQDHVLETAASLTMLQRSVNARRLDAAPARVLVIGNPRSDSDDPATSPDAERDAREIAALYPDHELLVDAAATRARVLEAAGAHDVVHFAGHAVSNDDYPALSRLLLSGTGESARSLFAHEIAGLHLDRVRLVVLGACRTSAGRIRRGEGVLSLARPFIAAGAQTVVASLWDVDDRASHPLFVAFHRALRRGEPIAESLRSAQLAALASRDAVLRDPANWATFTVIGGLPALRANP